MDQQNYIDLIDSLRNQSGETPWLEFKRDLDDPKKIGETISAMSNSARLNDKDEAFLVWGIEDKSHKVVGTNFNPHTKKVGNQFFELWLRNKLAPSPAFEFTSVKHPDGPVVLLRIPATMSVPTAYDNILYIRIGSATTRLSNHLTLHQKLMAKLQSGAWESGVASSYLAPDDVLQLLDWETYFSLLYPEMLSGSHPHILNKMKEDRLIQSDTENRWSILNLGAILFANDLGQFGGSLERKGVRFARYDGIDRGATVTHPRDDGKGYAVGFEALVTYIDRLIPKSEQIDMALRKSRPPFPILAVRELVANALIHQDMTITGAGPMIELFDNRIEISNPGNSLVDRERMVDKPPRSRNEELAKLMRRMGMCEERGIGLDRVFILAEDFNLPAPTLRIFKDATQVIMHGPRPLSKMTQDERIEACYWHAVLRHLKSERMTNATLRERLGIEDKNAAQASTVIKKTMAAELIKYADEKRPKTGYHPFWG